MKALIESWISDKYWHYIANGEEPLVKEQENTKEEKSHSKASKADPDFCNGRSKHMFFLK